MSNAPQPVREISPEIRRRVYLWNGGMALLFIVISWGLYLAEAVFKINLFGSKDLKPGEMNDVLFWFAVGASVIAIGWGLWSARKAFHLARYGVEVRATISSIGSISHQGQTKVYFRYTYNNTQYEQAMSALRTAYEVGEPYDILVDPKNPKRYVEAGTVLGFKKKADA